jgi:small-conductance mechanosensitive channel
MNFWQFKIINFFRFIISQNNPVPVVPVMQDINQSPASKQSFKSPIKPAQKKEIQETDKQKQEDQKQEAQEAQEAQETQDAINKQKETNKQIDRYTMINQIETPAQANLLSVVIRIVLTLCLLSNRNKR